MTDAAFIPSSEALASIPALYETEPVPVAEKVIHPHYFLGSCDWWVAELDPATGLAFGYANLGDDQNAEWGYFDLHELAAISVRHRSGFVLTVERDMHFEPRPFAALDRVG